MDGSGQVRLVGKAELGGEARERRSAGHDRFERRAGAELVAIAGQRHAAVLTEHAAEMPWRNSELFAEGDEARGRLLVQDLAGSIGDATPPLGRGAISGSSRRALGHSPWEPVDDPERRLEKLGLIDTGGAGGDEPAMRGVQRLRCRDVREAGVGLMCLVGNDPR